VALVSAVWKYVAGIKFKISQKLIRSFYVFSIKDELREFLLFALRLVGEA